MSLAIFVLLLSAPAASLEFVCGWYHNCVFERGTAAMKCWGKNNQRQLGYDDNNYRGDSANEMGSNLPIVNLGTDCVIEAMSLGRDHSCAMSDDRAMKCFGSNANSQLGFDGETTTGDALPFLDFGVDFIVSKITAGYYHTCALLTDSALKCFGRNDVGQCGAGTTTTPMSGPPSQINAVDFGTGFTPIDVDAFAYHTCALSQQDTVKCFGRNVEGQLGYGDTTNRGRTPESMGDGLPIVNLGSNFIVAAIATGAYHSCALSTTKHVKCWGGNYYGQCGTIASASVVTDTGNDLPVLEFGADFIPMQLALGGWHTCILSEAATLICFGDNAYGQLGIGSTTNVYTPSTLTGIDLGSNFVPRQVAAGYEHTCAVSTGAGVKCWGNNGNGQLGLGHSNRVGDGANEMGNNLPFVDVAWPTVSPTISSPTASPSTTSPTTTDTTSPSKATPTTATPTTASPTTTTPTTASPTTATPTTATPTTTTPTTASPTTDSPTTASPTTATPTTDSPTTDSPTTASPTTATPTTASPSTYNPTTAQPSTQSPTTLFPSTASNNNTVTVTIRTDSLSSTEILIAIANAYNLSSTLLTITTLSSDDDDEDGFATVELLVAVPSDVELDYDVIEATLREAMVDEYGDGIEVDIDVDDDTTNDRQEEESVTDWSWLVPVALCIVSVCFGFAVFGVIKYILAKRRQNDIGNRNQMHAAQIEIPERPRPLAADAQNAYGVHSESEAEEKKEDGDVNPGAGGEPDLELEQSVSNSHEGRRASVAAQTAAVTAGMVEDEFEILDDRETDAGHSANFVRAEPTPAGMEEDEFEVVDDDSNQVNTAGHPRSE